MPSLLQFLQSQLDKALNKVTTPKDISENFGVALAGLRAYGFPPSDLTPEQIDKLIADVKNFFHSTESSTFSANTSASFLGISGAAGMSMSQLRDQMKDTGWNFSTEGKFTIPKSLTVNVLDTAALTSVQNVIISITKTDPQVVALQTDIDSGACFVPTSSIAPDVGNGI